MEVAGKDAPVFARPAPVNAPLSFSTCTSISPLNEIG